MNKPISPNAVLDALPAAQEADKQATVDFINGILLLPDSIAALVAGDFVLIMDNSRSPRFARTAPAIVKEYEALGWNVRPGVTNNQWAFRLPPMEKSL